MTSDVVFIVLFAAFLNAAWNALIKISGQRMAVMAAVTLAGSVGSLLALPFVELPSKGSVGFLIASILLHTVYHFALPRAYDHGPMGQVYPIMRGVAPVLVALFGFLAVGEKLPPWQAFGVLCVAGGIATLALDRRDGLFGNPRALLWSLGTGLVIASYTVVDGLGARASGSPIGFAALLTLGDGLLTCAIVICVRPQIFALALKTDRWRSIAGGVMQAGAYWIAVWALTRAPLGMVSAVRETSVIFGALLSSFVLGEGLSAWRFISSVLVFAGVVLCRQKP